jgi:hypothetical protein
MQILFYIVWKLIEKDQNSELQTTNNLTHGAFEVGDGDVQTLYEVHFLCK